MEKLLTPVDVASILQASKRTAYTIMREIQHPTQTGGRRMILFLIREYLAERHEDPRRMVNALADASKKKKPQPKRSGRWSNQRGYNTTYRRFCQ